MKLTACLHLRLRLKLSAELYLCWLPYLHIHQQLHNLHITLKEICITRTYFVWCHCTWTRLKKKLLCLLSHQLYSNESKGRLVLPCVLATSNMYKNQKFHAHEMKQLKYITDKYQGPKHVKVAMSERRGSSNKKLLWTKWSYQYHSTKIFNSQTFQYTDTRQKHITM